MIRRSSMAACLAVGLMLPAAEALAQGNPPISIQVPVIINLYPNSGTTEQEARDPIKEANKSLKQAAYKLVPVRVNTIMANSGGQNQFGGDNGDGGGTAGDGDFTEAELRNTQTFGGRELRALPNMRGLKINFARTPLAGSTTPGASIHRNPTIIVKKRANAQQTGETIAHETGHVLTLGPGHVIDNATRADAGGHAPNRAGNSGNANLVAPSNRRTGTNLTTAQIDEVRTVRFQFGKCSTQFNRAFPALKDAEQFGGATDARGDQNSPDYFDLDQVVLTSLDAAGDMTGGDVLNIHAQITVAGLLPTAGQIDATYALGFNTDGSASGVMYAGADGIDRIVYITANGDMSLGTFTLSGQVLDTATNTLVALPGTPVAVTDAMLFDLEGGGDPASTSFQFAIPKSLLNLLTTEVPVVAVSGMGGMLDSIGDDVISDTADLIFDTNIYLDDPTLMTFGNGVPKPGQEYQFSIAGLTPNDAFNLFLDDEIVFSGMLNALGGFAGSFLFPTFLPNDVFYFLTAQDSTGEFAYSMTCPIPEPSSLVLLACGALSLIGLGRVGHRRQTRTARRSLDRATSPPTVARTEATEPLLA